MEQVIVQAVKDRANPDKARHLMRFFKTGPGDYAEGDIFAGVIVPELRSIAREHYAECTLDGCAALLMHPLHEVRFTALVILISKYEKTKDQAARAGLIQVYLDNLAGVNNWDLVDISAPKLLGPWLLDKDRNILYQLAASGELWKERIAVLATFAFIRAGDYRDTLQLAADFLEHPHDLMHKAVGWMLREIGNRDKSEEKAFLDLYAHRMPRTMLRYAIEKFPESERRHYLAQGRC